MAGISVHDDRNRCSASVGIGVHLGPEWPFMMGRNTHEATLSTGVIAMATERADMLLDRLQAKDALVFNVGDTLDTKLNIALVVITFLATQTAWLITEKRVEGGWLIAQSVSALALIAAGALTIWALWPTNYATENAEDWDLWLERLDAYFASDPNRDDKVRQVATDGAIKRARERIASNSRVNNFKTQLLTVSFWCSSLSLALNLATVASFAAKRLF